MRHRRRAAGSPGPSAPVPGTGDPTSSPPERTGVSRRALLGGALGGAGVAVLAGGGGYGVARATEPAAASTQVPFYGARQAGIATPSPDRLAFAAFDVTTLDVQALQGMLGQWAAAAARMTAGELVGPTDTTPQAPPVDTGEAVGLDPANLTITVGFGPSLFDERFGLAHKRPAALAPLPTLPGDGAIDPTRSNGDICVQACSDDPQVAFHAIRNLSRIGTGTVVMRWSQLGFGRTSSTSTTQVTERNLMGFKDGTNNLKAQEAAALDQFVWVGDETDQAWMRGGSYLVSRRIRMQIEQWDADYLADQQHVFGRYKTSGAPLTGAHEFDAVDLDATSGGKPVIPANAHIRLANPVNNGNQRILRRGFSYTDGTDPSTGQLDAGLFFIAFQKNAHTQFVPIQTNLGTHDALNEYIKHTSSGLFAVPPGVTAVGDYFGKALFS